MSRPRRRGAACLHEAPVAPVSPPEMVDVAFELGPVNGGLPEGFEWPLYREVARLAPWLGESAHSGIHPLRGSRMPDGSLLLARRAKLVVRMPRDRVCAASALERAELDVGGVPVTVGSGTFRKLRPAGTLYSPFVAMGESEEARFSERVAEALRRLDIHNRFLCGRRALVRFEGRVHTAFSVAVHGLGEFPSLLLQHAGLGRGHAVGCGLFVPHKAIEAAE